MNHTISPFRTVRRTSKLPILACHLLNTRRVDRIGLKLWRFLISCVALSPLLCGEIRVLGVTTSAAFVNGFPGPGSLATIFCTGLEGITGTQVPSETPLPRMLAGVRVSLSTQDAPMLAVADLGAFQIVSFQVPWEGAGPFSISQGSNSAALPGQSAPWGQFFIDPSGDVYAQHVSDYRAVTSADPARPGEWIVLLGTNFGDVFSHPPTGAPAAAQPLSSVDPGSPIGWSYTVNLLQSGQLVSLESNYIGLAPGRVGVYQINARMPKDLAPGTVSLYLQRSRFCGFFFTPGCGRGQMLDISTHANLRVAP